MDSFVFRVGLLALLFAAGCRSQPASNQFAATDSHGTSAAVASRSADGATTRVSYDAAAADDAQPPREVAAEALTEAPELSPDALVAAVEQRNPSLEGMTAAWQAASQRFPQAVALDDPMLQSTFAPASIGSSSVEPAYAIQLSQKIPLGGKRAARGSAAQAEADAAYHDLEEMRLRLAETTRLAFYDYYLARRDLDLNAASLQVMNDLRQTALARYQANQVTQQDVLQADVELADLQRRRIEIDRMLRISIVRINSLLRRPPRASLPPPQKLASPGSVAGPEVLEQAAFARRPDLAALESRVAAQSAAVDLACQQRYPDVEIFGRYDTFWQPESQNDLRGQVGVNVNLPVYRGKLNAAVNEAAFRLSQRRAELEQRRLDIEFEVQSAYEQLNESRRTVRLYAERFLPAAEQNVAASRANYAAGAATFLGLAEAERKLIDLREKQEEAIAGYHRRLAQLERVLAGPLPQ